VGNRSKTALRRSIAWYLRQWSRLLNVLNDEELDRLIPLLSERSFRPRQQLFSTGEAPDRVYLLLKGRVKVYQVAENGKEVILDIVTKGGIVGDMAIVENGERTACAQALDDAVAVTISWEDFTYFMQQSPRLGFAMGLTHAELAQTIGTSRESVTALLSRFVVLGALEAVPGGYRIADAGVLRAVASGELAVSPRHPVAPRTSAAAG
jgi:CRP/FNR family transcriptional regulator